MQLKISKLMIGSLSAVCLIGSGVMAQGRPVETRGKGRAIERKTENLKKEIETGKKGSVETRVIDSAAPLATPGADLPASGAISPTALEKPSIEKLGQVCGAQAAGQAVELMTTATDAEVAAHTNQIAALAKQVAATQVNMGLNVAEGAVVKSLTTGGKGLKGDSAAQQGQIIAIKAYIEAGKGMEKDPEVIACRGGSASACSIAEARRQERALAPLMGEEGLKEFKKNGCMSLVNGLAG